MRLTKRCPRCCAPGQELPASVFAPDAARYDGLSPYCVPCKRAVQRESWQRHSDEWTPLYAKRLRARRRLMKERVAKYLMAHPCVDCGERDLDVLEFDHRAGEGKDAEVSRLVNDGAAWHRIEREMAKCEVRCANDHRRKHARERRQLEQERGVVFRKQELPGSTPGSPVGVGWSGRKPRERMPGCPPDTPG